MPTSFFTISRRIAWGECDPARIYYTPRAVDYAVEAVEAWSDEVFDSCLADLADSHGFDVPFVRVTCDYHRPVVASQVIELSVQIAAMGRCSITFAVVGKDGKGATCFLAHLTVCFVEKKHCKAAPIPAGLRRIIEACHGEGGTTTEALHGDDLFGQGAGTVDLVDYRPGNGAIPFAQQRRVVYGDCNPSGKIYAPRVFDYAVEAIGEWYEDVLEISWMDLVCVREEGAPFVSARCDYLRPLIPGQVVDIAVWVDKMGGASINFMVIGYDAGGEPIFDARLAACFISQHGFKPMRIPKEFRHRIVTYQAACEAAALQ